MEQGRAGNRISLPTEKQTRQRCSLLSLHLSALSTPQHCPQQVGHSRGSKGRTFFLWADCRSQEARLPPHPARAIPTPADRRGARAPRKGTCCETLEHTSPSRPFPAKISPTPRQRSLSPPQGVLEKAFELRVQVFSPEAARTKALPETQNRDTEV